MGKIKKLPCSRIIAFQYRVIRSASIFRETIVNLKPLNSSGTLMDLPTLSSSVRQRVRELPLPRGDATRNR